MNIQKNKVLTIATRKSKLALWQAEHVKAFLEAAHPNLTVQLLKVVTKGDQILDAPLAKIGGKGLFIKELENAMLADKADIAVHSMKDVPAELPPGFCLSAILKREDPFDAWVSDQPFEALPAGARVGTCSLRRKVQLKALRPDLTYLDLRGNVNTRLQKFDEAQFEGIVLAAAGLKRLKLENRIHTIFSEKDVLPAVGQGAIGIECLAKDKATQALLAPLVCQKTTACVLAERAMNARLGGSCQVPVAGFAVLEDTTLFLKARVGNLAGTTLLKAEAEGPIEDPVALGNKVADSLEAQGALGIIDEIIRSA